MLTSAADTAEDPDELLRPAEVAELAKLSVSTLKDRRWKGMAPSFVKLSPGRGGRIRYRRGDVIAWLSERAAE